MKEQIRISEIKQALQDHRFRDKLPESLLPEVQAFLNNPGCGCNRSFFYKLVTECSDQLKQYFPTKILSIEEKPQWQVINCHVDNLSLHLKNLPIGNKKIAVARWEDQVTVIVNFTD